MQTIHETGHFVAYAVPASRCKYAVCRKETSTRTVLFTVTSAETAKTACYELENAYKYGLAASQTDYELAGQRIATAIDSAVADNNDEIRDCPHNSAMSSAYVGRNEALAACKRAVTSLGRWKEAAYDLWDDFDEDALDACSSVV